jgi:predicted nicotinamide N-methyase
MLASVLTDAAAAAGLIGLIVGALAGAATWVNRTTDNQFKQLRDENSQQHQEARTNIAFLQGQVASVARDVSDVKERTARLEGGQQAITSVAVSALSQLDLDT